MLPAAGFRYYTSGALFARGYRGYYWSSLEYRSSLAWSLHVTSRYADPDDADRLNGFSVRCVSE